MTKINMIQIAFFSQQDSLFVGSGGGVVVASGVCGDVLSISWAE